MLVWSERCLLGVVELGGRWGFWAQRITTGGGGVYSGMGSCFIFRLYECCLILCHGLCMLRCDGI